MDSAVKILVFIVGIATGYFASLGYSYKKAADAVSRLPAVVKKMDDHSERDIAVLIRALKVSKKGLDPNEDPAVLWNLADFYHKRRKLTDKERSSLGSDPLLEMIGKLSEENPALKSALDKGNGGS